MRLVQYFIENPVRYSVTAPPHYVDSGLLKEAARVLDRINGDAVHTDIIPKEKHGELAGCEIRIALHEHANVSAIDALVEGTFIPNDDEMPYYSGSTRGSVSEEKIPIYFPTAAVTSLSC